MSRCLPERHPRGILRGVVEVSLTRLFTGSFAFDRSHSVSSATRRSTPANVWRLASRAKCPRENDETSLEWRPSTWVIIPRGCTVSPLVFSSLFSRRISCEGSFKGARCMRAGNWQLWSIAHMALFALSPPLPSPPLFLSSDAWHLSILSYRFANEWTAGRWLEGKALSSR